MVRAATEKRPQSGSVTARVWEIADELKRRTGRLPGGREVADAFVAEGGNAGTAFTQYSRWKKAQLSQGCDAGDARPEGAMQTMRLTIGADGRVVIPAEMRRAMGIDKSGVVTAQVVEGELRMLAPRVALERARALVRMFDKGRGSPVDELIAERRAEAERE
jgi:bifunctional DNA-binding transcriptional regulator/antitoxin component of YhaV-PrlF toxin-antitoxin module